MNKNTLGEGRMMPLDDEGLQAMLANGPPDQSSDVSKTIPPIPRAPLSAASVAPPVEEETTQSEPEEDEGPDKDMLSRMVLPTEREKIDLKKRFGDLRVVPLPYTRADGKIQTYILRTLTRSQWRVMEDAAVKVSESKPGISSDEIFKEKIVSLACVWPGIPEHEIPSLPPGLVPTLFGIVQQMGLFFNPEAIMSVTFVL